MRPIIIAKATPVYYIAGFGAPAPDELGSRAAKAYARIINHANFDGPIEVSDLDDFRAWITYHRLRGHDEKVLGLSIATADMLALKLGVE